MDSDDSFPTALLLHLHKRLNWGLEAWNDLSMSDKKSFAVAIVDRLVYEFRTASHIYSRETSKQFSCGVEFLAKAFRSKKRIERESSIVHNEADIHSSFSTSSYNTPCVALFDLVRGYVAILNRNRQHFDTVKTERSKRGRETTGQVSVSSGNNTVKRDSSEQYTVLEKNSHPSIVPSEHLVSDHDAVSDQSLWSFILHHSTVTPITLPPPIVLDDVSETVGTPGPVASHSNPTQVLELPVVIIGGGIGGLSLAGLLAQAGVHVVLFEKDKTVNCRKQGYALTIQQGAAVLESLSCDSKMDTLATAATTVYGENEDENGCYSSSHASYTHVGKLLGTYMSNNPQYYFYEELTGELSISCPSGTGSRNGSRNVEGAPSITSPVMSPSATSATSSRPRRNAHVPRQLVRERLLDRLSHVKKVATRSTNPCIASDEVVQWGEKFVKYEEVADPSNSNNDHVNVYFESGKIVKASVLVAADGIYSQVRMQKLPHVGGLNYLGFIVLLGIAPSLPHVLSNDVSADTHHAYHQHQWLDGTSRVFTMPFDATRTMWQMSFPMTAEEAVNCGLMYSSSKANILNDGVKLKELAIQRCGHWHKPLASLIHSTDTALISGHPVYDRDPLTLQQCREASTSSTSSSTVFPSSRVTLVGDAAHPMSPFKAQGANQALLDAHSLAQQLLSVQQPSYCHSGNRSVPNALVEFESEMLGRSAAKVLKSRSAAVQLHSSQALQVGNITRAGAASARAFNTTPMSDDS